MNADLYKRAKASTVQQKHPPAAAEALLTPPEELYATGQSSPAKSELRKVIKGQKEGRNSEFDQPPAPESQ